MIRVLRIAGIASLVLALAAAAVSYSWTFTPHGRLDYRAAVLAKMATWAQSGPMMLTAEARAMANERTRSMQGAIEGRSDVRFEDREIAALDGAKIPIRIYWPPAASTDAKPPLYLDIHGGGWWMGNDFVFHDGTTRFAADAGAIVVSVDYRLAPEHPYPTPLDDCAAAFYWMVANAAALGGDAALIGIGGGSAGGNLSAALALRIRDEGGPKIGFQYLLIPATDLSGVGHWPSHREVGEGYVLTASGLEQMYAAYVPDPAERRSPYVSPYLAEDLSGLPAGILVTNSHDPLRDEGEGYGKRLQQAGVDLTMHREPGLHGMLGSPQRMMKVQAMAAARLREVLGVD